MNWDAEELMDLAREVMEPKDRLVRTDGFEMRDAEVVVLAIRFYQQPASFKLRALVERWSRYRIVREIY